MRDVSLRIKPTHKQIIARIVWEVGNERSNQEAMGLLENINIAILQAMAGFEGWPFEEKKRRYCRLYGEINRRLDITERSERATLGEKCHAVEQSRPRRRA